ncbi:uracil phosphoribosyltransferase-domain-containing protein [Xylaria bambusicola]|uniref:uracil phosphoribosyltransferase-domain-containing protein n=1 Tax=Xylaria bambusicola TaxID=326684 RepID=UPI002007F577|nr:uracil phosphoribosyltransferase-domain-containing protein [Xylaria bambusicola]KAI0508581.1 uracil phosphoribosyltransferase-domain-containing protein [Xylaria bambusicola]
MDTSTFSVEKNSENHASIVTLSPSISTIKSLLPVFLDRSTDEASMHDVVGSMTVEVVRVAKERNEQLGKVPVTLVPILRGALPMYVAASGLFESPSCGLVRGIRAKENTDAQIEWLGRRPYPLIPQHGHIVLLDTVIATGGTILSICNELLGLSGPRERYITVLSCYVSPIGLRAVAEHPLIREVVVAARAESVDENGYVVPYPGDVGDKLFGKAVSS